MRQLACSAISNPTGLDSTNENNVLLIQTAAKCARSRGGSQIAIMRLHGPHRTPKKNPNSRFRNTSCS